MPDPTDPWWTQARRRLSELLEVLDRHDETLIAAHVATALDCLDTRYDARPKCRDRGPS